MNRYVVGVDFGTGGVRVVVVDARTGGLRAAAAAGFPRWERGALCDPARHVFRQDPVELIDAYHDALSTAVASLSEAERRDIAALSIDTTGSSPTAIGRDGIPLALSPAFRSGPEAMVILWKDHSAAAEARAISDALGTPYPAEWFWAKVLRASRAGPAVREAASTWAEHADWFPAYICGNRTPSTWKRCRSGAAHKALWRPPSAGHGGGYPSRARLETVDPYLGDVLTSLGSNSWSPHRTFGTLSEEEAAITGLPPGIPVGVGVFDAHSAACAGGIRRGVLIKTIGTSSSDIAVADASESDRFPGVESAALGSIIPDLVTIESGQAAYGDLTEWLVRLVSFGGNTEGGTDAAPRRREAVYRRLEEQATGLPLESIPVSLDWFNGRRAPYGTLDVRGAIHGLTLATSAPALYLSLLEAAAFATRSGHDHLRRLGVPIEEVVVLGGVAERSPLAVSILASVLNTPLAIPESSEASAWGAAIYAAVAGGVHRDIAEAQDAMRLPNRTIVYPDADRVALHNARYARYRDLAEYQTNREA
ncbi:MAG: ribulokinase [Spirochaetales bacterium]|nr:ribulokinase [Spirochaetales bacterium]